MIAFPTGLIILVFWKISSSFFLNYIRIDWCLSAAIWPTIKNLEADFDELPQVR